MTVSDRRATRIAWTERQREVLDLLTRGHTNAQIADALGISLDGAKWHVSEIITRLGVDSRDEAAEYWRAENGLRLRFTRALRALWPSALWVRIAAGVGVVGLATVAAMAIAVFPRSDERSGTAQPPDATTVAAAVTPLPSAGATTATIATSPPGATALVVTASAAVPPGLELLYTKACGSCAPEGLFRAYRDATGQLRNDALWVPTDPITSIAVSDVRHIAATTCAPAMQCSKYAWIDGKVPSMVSSLLTSEDGGVTWNVRATFPSAIARVAWSVDALIVTVSYPNGPDTETRTFPGGQPVTPPVGADTSSLTVIDGRLAWTIRSKRVDANGHPIASTLPAALAAAIQDATSFDVRSERGGLLATWVNPANSNAVRIQTFTNGGSAGPLYEMLGSIAVVARKDGAVAYANLMFGPEKAGPLNGPANLAGRYLPTRLNLSSGTATPFADPFVSVNPSDRFTLLAAQDGSFARVHTGTDCLNVRESPNTSATSLGCFNDGVLLDLLDFPQGVHPAGWLPVNSPDGRPGWASTEFLQR